MPTFRTLELAIQFHERVEKIEIHGHLRDQLLRASSSIALNLTEGNPKASPKEKKRFYQTAYGSLKECQTIFRLVKSKDSELNHFADQLGGSLFKLMNSKLKGLQEAKKRF